MRYIKSNLDFKALNNDKLLTKQNNELVGINLLNFNYAVENTAELKKLEILTEDTIVYRSGYYNSLDGGSVSFVIKSAANAGTANEQTIIDMNNGMKAVYNEKVYHANALGFNADGTTDNLAFWNGIKGLFQVGDVFQFGVGTYYFSDEIEVPITMTISGYGTREQSSTILKFAEDKNGIVIGVNKSMTRIKNLEIEGVSTSTIGIGIKSNSAPIIEQIGITYFPEYGLWIRGNTPTSEGNSNHFSVSDVYFRFIDGTASYISGIDANDGSISNCVALDCGNGYYDGSALGNLYSKCHAEGVTTGFRFKTENGNNRCLFLNCYTEDGSTLGVQVNAPSLWIGGTLGSNASTTWNGTGHYIYGASGKLFTNNSHVFGNDSNDAQLELLSNSNEFMRMNDLGNSNPSAYYELSINGQGLALIRNGFDAGTAYVAFSERNAAKFGSDRPIAPTYGMWFPNGFILGERFQSGSQRARMWSMGETAPTSGEWASGDKQWNINYYPSVQGSVEYWQCITGGSPGTWEAIYASINNTGVSTINTTSTVSGSKVYLIDSSGGAITLTISDLDNKDGNEVVVKDLGNALTNNITIQLESGTIDGAASQSLTTNFSSFTLVFNGGNAFII